MADRRSSEDAPSTDIDRVVHEPVRLRILSCLFVVESADFLFLMQRLRLTQGNLSSHMSKLELAGYVDVDKTFIDKRPRSLLRLTPKGRAAFEHYISGMKQFLAEVEPPPSRPDASKAKVRTVRASRSLKPRTT